MDCRRSAIGSGQVCGAAWACILALAVTLVLGTFAEPAHARDLLWRQSGKGLLQAGKRACEQGAVISAGSSRGGHSHLRLTLQEGSKTCRGPNPAIRPAFLRRRHVVRRFHQGKMRARYRFVPAPAIFAA